MTASDGLARVLESAGWPGLAQIAMGAAGLAWAAAVAVQLARGRRVAPALATAPVGLHALVVLFAVAAAWKAHAVAGIDAEEAHAIGGLMNNLMLTVTALPAMAVLAVGGFAGGFRAPRALGLPMRVSLVAASLAACMPLFGLAYGVLPLYAIGRSVLYGCGAVLISGASSGGEPDRRLASVTAAVGFGCGVIAVEALLRTIGWIHCLAAAARVEDKGAFLGLAADNIAITAPISWAAIGLAGIPLVVACLRAPRSKATLLAAVVPLAWLAIWVLADPAGPIAAVAANPGVEAR